MRTERASAELTQLAASLGECSVYEHEPIPFPSYPYEWPAEMLHAAGMLSSPEPSGSMESWGSPGPGRWISVYADAGHVFMVVAGLRFDTSGLHENGSRWTSSSRSMSGFRARHPARF